MPTYSFRDKNTGEEFDLAMKIAKLDPYLRKNKHIEQIIKCSKVGDVVLLGHKKPSGQFRERLQEIKRTQSRGLRSANINTF